MIIADPDEVFSTQILPFALISTCLIIYTIVRRRLNIQRHFERHDIELAKSDLALKACLWQLIEEESRLALVRSLAESPPIDTSIATYYSSASA